MNEHDETTCGCSKVTDGQAACSECAALGLDLDDAKRVLAKVEADRERIRTLERHVLVLGLYIRAGDRAVTAKARSAAMEEVERLMDQDA